MSIWDYWNETDANRNNLRLYTPGRGWLAYSDKLDDEGNVEERGSREQIDSALINALSASNFSTLTGAGASLCATNEDGGAQAPSMSDLWNAVKEEVGDAEFAAIRARFPNAQSGENIERLLTLCKIYLDLNDGAQDDDQDVAGVRAFVANAESTILRLVDFVGPGTDLDSHQRFIRKIGRRGFRKARAKLFTTNYDLAFEEASRRLRFMVIDGFSHSLDQVYDRQHFEFDVVRREANKEAPDYIPNAFQLYKLHGSADWRRVGSDVVRSRQNTNEYRPVLIYPRSSKYQEAFDPPYLDMMGAFQMALREPDTALIVAGFGFNDDHISSPILSAIESNLSLRLVICDPSFITSENDLRGVDPDPPAHTIIQQQPHSNRFLARISSLAAAGDPRIHLINGRFEDLVDAMPDLIGETDRERHVERVRVLRDNPAAQA